jgi:hypothetical protein
MLALSCCVARPALDVRREVLGSIDQLIPRIPRGFLDDRFEQQS